MSTVRMSHYLKHEIKNKFQDAWKKANPIPELTGKEGDALYNKFVQPKIQAVQDALTEAWGEYADADHFFADEDHMGCSATINDYVYEPVAGDPEERYILKPDPKEDRHFSVPLSTKRSIPCYSRGSYYSEKIRFAFPRDDEVFNQVCEKMEKANQLKVKLRHRVNKIDDLLDQFTTLNQALKAWPAISKLVPQDKIAKVHEKQQRKRKEAQRKEVADEIVIDNELNQTILTAALLGDDE